MATASGTTSGTVTTHTQQVGTKAFQEYLQGCTDCPLHETRTLAVAGEGSLGTKVVIVGEAPGATEDETGRPFQGAAGRLLTEMLNTVGVRRGEVFITNAVRCRPTKKTARGVANAKPSIHSVRRCKLHLLAELGALNPNVIVPMGDVPLTSLFGSKAKITKMRGEVFELELPTSEGRRKVKVIPTFHPSYALRFGHIRATIEQDLRKVLHEAETMEVSEPPKTEVYTVRTVEDVRALVDEMLKQPLVAWDTETSGPALEGGLDMRYARPICFSFSWEVGEGWVIPLWYQLPKDKWDSKTGYFDWKDVVRCWTPEEWVQVTHELRRFLESDVPKTGQNLTFDEHVANTIGIHPKNCVFDTMIADYILDENVSHSLESLRTRFTPLPRYEAWKDTELPRANAPYLLVDPEKYTWPYAGADTDVTLRAAYRLMEEFDKPEHAGLLQLFTKIAMPLRQATFIIERNGMYIDYERMMDIQRRYNAWILEEEQNISKLVAEKTGKTAFNYRSTKQLAEVLFTDLGMEAFKFTAADAPSVDVDVLLRLEEENPDEPILKAIMRARKLRKMRDTYLAGEDGLSGMRYFLDDDNYIHTTFRNTRTATGRLSSADPNLQNITKKKDTGADDVDDPAEIAVRGMFAAPPGYYLMEADYSQLELRIQAYWCGEKVLLDAFAQSGGAIDQHRLTAALVFKIPQDQVNGEQRNYGKRANFAVGYGGGVAALVRATKMDTQWCRDFLVDYRNGYPATEAARKRAARELLEKGYVETPFGRRRRLPEYPRYYAISKDRDNPESSKAWKEAAQMERQAYNFWIQSIGSDFLSLSTIEAVLHDEEIRRLGMIPCLSLHDALYFYVPIANVDAGARAVKRIMEGQTQRFKFFREWVLPVDITWGLRWGETVGELKG